MTAYMVVVGAAILRGEGAGVEVLAAQRMSPPALAGGWEFVGGKVELGEDDQEALQRECREELGVEVSIGQRIGGDVVIAGSGAVLRVWIARITSGVPRSDEHGALRWVPAADLSTIEWLPADLPIVHALQQLLAWP